MRSTCKALAAAAGISVLAACTSGQAGVEPPSTVTNVQTTTVLQFRVGTARFSDGTVGLNTLETYRQPNGVSGTLLNNPSITGPAGFTVPNNAFTAGNTDDGTATINSTPPTQPGITPVVTTFGTSGGAFAYGFAPANSTTSGAANYAQYVAAGANNAIYRDADSAIIVGPGAGNTQNSITPSIFGVGRVGVFNFVYAQPFYVSSTRRLPFLLGPPAVPDFHNGAYPGGFLGYDSGFTSFAVGTPPTGTYTMTLNVPSNTIGQLAATFTQTASLASNAALGTVTPPVITPDGAGGASFLVAPGPPGVTNQVLYIVDVSAATNAPTMYAFKVPAAGGTFALSPTAGPQNAGGTPSKPFNSGDSVYAYVVGADYDIVGDAVPVNMQQAPPMPAQADISVSLVTENKY